jgi:topoisomerase IA-like protein
MAKVRFLGAEPHLVPELGDRLVEPDEVVTVPDERFEAFLLHPHLWESVEEPKEPAPPAKKAAAKKTAARKTDAKKTTGEETAATSPAAATDAATSESAATTTEGTEG